MNGKGGRVMEGKDGRVMEGKGDGEKRDRGVEGEALTKGASGVQ